MKFRERNASICGSTRRRSARHSWSCVERVGERHSRRTWRNGKGHTHAYRVTGNLFTPGIHGIRKSYQRREHSLLCKIAIPLLGHDVTNEDSSSIFNEIVIRRQIEVLSRYFEKCSPPDESFERKWLLWKQKTMHVHGEYVCGGYLKIKMQIFRVFRKQKTMHVQGEYVCGRYLKIKIQIFR